MELYVGRTKFNVVNQKNFVWINMEWKFVVNSLVILPAKWNWSMTFYWRKCYLRQLFLTWPLCMTEVMLIVWNFKTTLKFIIALNLRNKEIKVHGSWSFPGQIQKCFLVFLLFARLRRQEEIHAEVQSAAWYSLQTRSIHSFLPNDKWDLTFSYFQNFEFLCCHQGTWNWT